jgi:hypothetical protein
MGSRLSQGDDRLTLSKAWRAKAFNLTFPPRDESAMSPHERISQKRLRRERVPCDARGEPAKMRLRIAAGAPGGQRQRRFSR